MFTVRDVVVIEVWEVRTTSSTPIRWNVRSVAMFTAQMVATCMNACAPFARAEQREYSSGALRTSREFDPGTDEENEAHATI